MLRRFKKWLLVTFLTSRYYLDIAIDKIFGLYYDRHSQTLQEASNPIVLESATSLAKKIYKRELSSEDVVRAFVQRIEEVNPLINAVVDTRFDEAVKEARKIDEELKSGAVIDVKEKPFLGVPFTTKESNAVKGMSNTYGLLNRKGHKADFDSDVVEKMKKAGAILIAVTNIPQLNLWQETYNPVYGMTSNPYNTSRTVGGSCGGEACNIASCGSPFGIGTDVAGSLRMPSFMCGTFGHKPTSDLVSIRGLTLKPSGKQGTIMVSGPMTKFAEDLMPVLRVLVGENINKLQLDQPVDVRQLKVFYVKNPQDLLINPFRSEMKEMFFRVVSHFTEILPNKPELLDIKELKFGSGIVKYWMSQDPNANIRRNLLDSKRKGKGDVVETIIRICEEILKICTGRSKYNMGLMLNLIDGFLPTDDPDWIEQETKFLTSTIIDILGSNGVILYPSAPWPASYHHTALLRPWNFNLFSIWNILKFPVTQVPLGLDRNGLPLGIQVVAAPYQDHLCIAVAKELESAFGGFIPPCRNELRNKSEDR